MADEQPLQNIPLDDEKRDTVRINLPQGTAGKPPMMPTPTVRLRPPGTPSVAAPSTEHKKATAAISQPAAPAKAKKDTAQVATADSASANPKKDTARVQMPVAKPSLPEMPRPTVKLKREEPPAPAPVATPKPVAPPVSVEAVPSGIGGIDVGLAVAAMLVALAVAGYLFSLNRS